MSRQSVYAVAMECSDCGERRAEARGYCQRCYGRRKRRGTLVGPRSAFPWPDNLLQRMEPQPDGCIHFTGALTHQGYGNLNYPGGQLAHRAAYEHFVGPIPEGYDVDHECHNRADCNLKDNCPHRRCVNWEHLAAKPHGENVKASPNFPGNRTHCPQGHPYDEANTFLDTKGTRRCRTCRRELDTRRRMRP